MPNDLPIQLSPERMLCSRHGEPLRAQWPKGAAIVMVKLFEVVLETREVRRRRFEGKLEDDDALAKMIGELLDATPACCRVSPMAMQDAYNDSGVGVVAQCVCGADAPGTPYRTKTRVFEHLCFSCVLYRMEVLN